MCVIDGWWIAGGDGDLFHSQWDLGLNLTQGPCWPARGRCSFLPIRPHVCAEHPTAGADHLWPEAWDRDVIGVGVDVAIAPEASDLTSLRHRIRVVCNNSALPPNSRHGAAGLAVTGREETKPCPRRSWHSPSNRRDNHALDAYSCEYGYLLTRAVPRSRAIGRLLRDRRLCPR